MKYLKYIIYIIGYIILEAFQIFWFPIIYNFRYRAREVVNHKLYTDNIYVMCGVYVNHNIIKYSKIEFWLYYWLVWIWLDDTVNDDIVSTELMHKIYLRKSTPRFIKKIILKSNVLNNHNKHSYNKIGNNIEYKDFNLIIILLQIIYSNNSNYKRVYFYTKDYSKTFLIKIFNKEFGWKPMEYNKGYGQLYKLVY